MNFQTTSTIPSKVAESVTFTIRKVTPARRSALRLHLAEQMGLMRDTLREARQLGSEGNASLAEAQALLVKQQGVKAQMDVEWVRWGLVRIDGLTIDGANAETANDLIDNGPEDLYYEILKAIKADAGLTEDEAGESEPLTTSGAQGTADENNISVPLVGDQAIS